MNIRPYHDSDYESVKSILQSGGNFDDVWDSYDHWKAKVKKDQSSILVAEDDGVVGCILIIRDQWTSFLFRLAVREDYRNKGVGTALLLAAENQLREEGSDEVAIFVDESDVNLQGYYEKKGYMRGGNYRCLYKKITK